MGTKNAKSDARSLDDIWRNGSLGHLPRPNIRRRIAVIAFENAGILDMARPLSAFATVNEYIKTEYPEFPAAYDCEVLAMRAGPVNSSTGVALVAGRAYGRVRSHIDTLIMPGGPQEAVRRAKRNRDLIKAVRRLADRVRRLASVCTGTFVLAEAGLLNGCTVTTHWASCRTLAEEYPKTTVDPDRIFIRDGSVYTSAGVTAGIDLALAMIEEDLGRDWTLTIARSMVVYLKRPGGQSQYSAPLTAQIKDAEILKGLPSWIVSNLAEDLSVAVLAERVGMSQRNFARVFRREMRTTPAKFVEAARLDVARRRLEESTLPVETLARELGFGNGEHMRHAFQRQLRVSPDHYRQRFGEARRATN